MKFTQTGTFRENSLAKLITINPKDRVGDIFLERLDTFLIFLAQEKPEIINEYISNLTQKLLSLTPETDLRTPANEIIETFSEYQYLSQHPQLTRAALNYFSALLQLDAASAWHMAEAEISMQALIQAWTYPSYFILQTLAETIDRPRALNFYKRYITQYYRDHPAADRDKFATLEEMLAHRLSGDTTSSDWVIVHTKLAEGKYAFKNKNCPICVDAMTELPDAELKYLVCCYGDYEKFRASYGDHVILTMEHTLMQGDAYCSRVLHDTRVDYDLRHPPQEFWENFEPGNEEIAKKYYNRD